MGFPPGRLRVVSGPFCNAVVQNQVIANLADLCVQSDPVGARIRLIARVRERIEAALPQLPQAVEDVSGCISWGRIWRDHRVWHHWLPELYKVVPSDFSVKAEKHLNHGNTLTLSLCLPAGTFTWQRAFRLTIYNYLEHVTYDTMDSKIDVTDLFKRLLRQIPDKYRTKTYVEHIAPTYLQD